MLHLAEYVNVMLAKQNESTSRSQFMQGQCVMQACHHVWKAPNSAVLQLICHLT